MRLGFIGKTSGEHTWVLQRREIEIGVTYTCYLGNSDVPARLGLETPAVAFGLGLSKTSGRAASQS
jgi:hypothetical protein